MVISSDGISNPRLDSITSDLTGLKVLFISTLAREAICVSLVCDSRVRVETGGSNWVGSSAQNS